MTSAQDASPSGAPAASGLSVRRLLALFLCVFLLHALPGGGHLQSQDSELLFRMAQGLVERGSLAVSPLEADPRTGLLPPGFPEHMTFATRQGLDGQFYAQYLPLQAVLATPLVVLARATEGLFAEGFAQFAWPQMSHQYHARTASDYWSRGVVAFLFNPLVGAASAVVLARFAFLLTGAAPAAFGAALLWAFATVGWAHSKTFFTEPLSGLFALLAADAIVRWHAADAAARFRWALAAGGFLALGNWVRVDSPLIAAGLLTVMGIDALLRWRRGELSTAEVVRDLTAAGGLAIAAFLALQGINRARYGEFDPRAAYADQAEGVKFTTPILVGLHGLLASPGKGILFFSPALVLGFWGWAIAWRRHRFAAAVCLAGFAPFLLAMTTWQNWEGGWCWGPRHIVQAHLPWMVGAAFLFGAGGWLRGIAMGFIAGVGVLVQVYGTSQSPLDFYHEYYRTPDDAAYYRVAYRPDEVARVASLFEIRDRRLGAAGEAPASVLPAPIVNSIYIPQETQWAGYAEMWGMGYCDWFLWRAITRQRSPDRWGGPEPTP